MFNSLLKEYQQNQTTSRIFDLVFVKLTPQSGSMAAVSTLHEVSRCWSDFWWNYFSHAASLKTVHKYTYSQKQWPKAWLWSKGYFSVDTGLVSPVETWSDFLVECLITALSIPLEKYAHHVFILTKNWFFFFQYWNLILNYSGKYNYTFHCSEDCLSNAARHKIISNLSWNCTAPFPWPSFSPCRVNSALMYLVDAEQWVCQLPLWWHRAEGSCTASWDRLHAAHRLQVGCACPTSMPILLVIHM